ncbi:retrotransposon protein, putative, ty1-copia subclass [Tanacetum coccineum]
MERGFLSQKGSGGGGEGRRGVKEKNVKVSNIEAVKEKDLNDEPVAMEVQSPLVDHTNAVKTGGGSYPPLPTQGTTPAGNTPGKSSYANGNGIDVVVPVESIRAISERFVNTAYGFFLGKRVAYPVVANYVRNTWGKFGLVKSMLNSSTGLFSFQFSSTDGLNSMLENGPWFIRNHPLILRKWNPDVDLLKEDVGNVPADMELKDNIVVAMPKIIREGHYTCTVHVEYEWKPPRPVPKKPIASPSGNKKKGVTQTTEVSNSNPFDVLNSVDNDVEKFKDLLIDGQAILVDEAGNPLKKVECPGDYDSEDEVASVDNDMARSLASERVGFGTQSLLEQWRDSYGNGDYDEDPYDDDMYEGHDLSQEIQAICDNLDIRVRGNLGNINSSLIGASEVQMSEFNSNTGQGETNGRNKFLDLLKDVEEKVYSKSSFIYSGAKLLGDPFVFGSQVDKAFYCDDPKNKVSPRGVATKIPTHWYNTIADLPIKPPPPLHPKTFAPLQPQDLSHLFPNELIKQETSSEQFIVIPDEVVDIYRLWCPTPVIRAKRLEKLLDTPARIYYKYEGVSPAGSHKPNTAVPQGVWDFLLSTYLLSIIKELSSFEWAIKFARLEGLIPTPEPTHVIAAAIREALHCKESGESKVILMVMCGHGHFNLPAYEKYLQGAMVDLSFSEDKIQASFVKIPQLS